MEKDQGGGSREGEKKGKRRDWVYEQFLVIFKYAGLFVMWYFSMVNIKLSGQFSRLIYLKNIYRLSIN